ncbi:MAG: hypothetical protein ACXU9Q_16450 [Gemmatimonadaceae bacterium]
MQTMKVKPWADGQGDHVVINKSDFDPEKHESLEPEVEVEATAEQDGQEDIPARRGRRQKAE